MQCLQLNCIFSSETAPSFEQISHAIKDVIDESMANDEDPDSVEGIAVLTPEHQLMNTWCWLNIKVRTVYVCGEFKVCNWVKFFSFFSFMSHLVISYSLSYEYLIGHLIIIPKTWIP